ncbi:hypothetical protein GW7_19102, partial [Heterocephalus glaber]
FFYSIFYWHFLFETGSRYTLQAGLQLTMWPSLALNSQGSSCLSLPSARITGVREPPHLLSPWNFFLVFGTRFCKESLNCPGWLWTWDPPASASQSAGMTGVRHQA